MLLATAGRKSSPQVRGSGTPAYPQSHCQHRPGKAWPRWLSARGPWARQAAACPATGLRVLLTTQRAGKQPCYVLLTHVSAAAPLPRGFEGGQGNWLYNHNRSLGKKVEFLSVLCRAHGTVGSAFWGGANPWRQRETRSAPGLFLARWLENASTARKRALARDAELDRSRSQDFAFQLSIGNRVFFIISSFHKNP